MGKLNKRGLELKLAFKKEMKEKRKNNKHILQANRAKLVIKNLSFKANEENLKTLFEQHGEVEEVNILKKEDGKMVGCAFIQFKVVQKAAKARHYLNGHTFFDRVLEVDFAKSRHKYKIEKKKQQELSVKTEAENDIDLSIVKIEKTEDDVEVKSEKDSDSENKNDSDSENKNDSESSSEADHSDSDNESETKSQVEDISNEKTNLDSKKPHVISNDVTEGKTVFIKNVPFSATNQDLKECISRFGPVYYALICVDRFTEHSKGTAFVKFRNKDDAEKCLQAGTELTLQGSILDCHPALHKDDLTKKEKQKNVKQKDSRNLYLVKEGVVLAGSKAAENVSASDMAKRLQLEQYKTQMLRNLNMYVSKTRLIIHNIPPTWDDSKLKVLFKKHSSHDAVIRESRIMRNMKDVDSRGIGSSKEYGFVTFSDHEDALHTLRQLNNNPTIFSANKRPIVAFSIESKTVAKVKEKRMQRSRMRNPNSKDYNPDSNKKEEDPVSQRKRKADSYTTKNTRKRNIEEDIVANNKFTGVTAAPGAKKMRSRYNLKTQAKLHFEHMKQEKKKKKMSKKTFEEKRKNFRKQPRQKLNKKGSVDNFSVLVNKYKESLKSVPLKTSKWYE